MHRQPGGQCRPVLTLWRFMPSITICSLIFSPDAAMTARTGTRMAEQGKGVCVCIGRLLVKYESWAWISPFSIVLVAMSLSLVAIPCRMVFIRHGLWRKRESISLDISAGGRRDEGPDSYSPTRTVPRAYYEDACNVHIAERIKKHVSIPVITAGKIGTISLDNQILEEGRADLVAMARQLFCDPYTLKKTLENREESTIRCT